MGPSLRSPMRTAQDLKMLSNNYGSDETEFRDNDVQSADHADVTRKMDKCTQHGRLCRKYTEIAPLPNLRFLRIFSPASISPIIAHIPLPDANAFTNGGKVFIKVLSFRSDYDHINATSACDVRRQVELSCTIVARPGAMINSSKIRVLSKFMLFSCPTASVFLLRWPIDLYLTGTISQRPR